jgi:hypothetical protein
VTNDLSCKFGIQLGLALAVSLTTFCYQGTYCISAIWSNLELFLGIIAANLALSRSIYVFFRYGKDGAGSSQSRGSQYPSRSGYINQASLRGDKFEPPSTFVASNGSQRSVPKSESSDTPLKPGIHMKTEFIVMEERPGNDKSPA